MDESVHPGSADTSDDGAFEALLWELFLRFVDMPGDRVDQAIRDAQRRLCEALDLDRATLWQIAPDDETDLRVSHVFERGGTVEHIDERTGSIESGESRLFLLDGADPFPATGSARLMFPWLAARSLAGLTTVIPSVDGLPPEAAHDAANLRRAATRSTVIVPLKTESGVLGCVAFASTSRERAWPGALVRRLELAAQVFARALNAKRALRVERENEARLALAAASANAGLWEYEIQTGRIRANDVVRRLLGLPDGGELTSDTILAVVHPDDREQYRHRLASFLDHDENYDQEYRLLLPDGTVRWINSKGKPFSAYPGQLPDRVFGASIDITERKRSDERLRSALSDLEKVRDQLQHENVSLRDQVQRHGAESLVVGTSTAIRAALALADQVAPTGATVLLLGETGTGKERFASYIHERSPRRGRPMVRVNCAAIPTTLIESELFGREKGAFTGALARQIGRFELANGSTIFLDEIGDLPLEIQVKLLRVIEERCLERLGNPRPVAVDVRIVAATHRDLANAVREGQFREDLYYRLNVFPIALPPLRERLDDIPLLARAMVDELGRTMGKRFDPLTHGALMALRKYHWPGNIRELRNVLERAMITSTSAALQIALPAAASKPRPISPASTLKDVERAHVLEVLAQTGWRIRGPQGAAAVLGIPPTTLENRMKRLGISRPNPHARPR